jgi:hypothetical protein
MSVREQGLRRLAAVTIALAATGVAGSAAAAVAAWAHTRADRAERAGSSQPATGGTESDPWGDDGSTGDAPPVTRDDGPPHATSGGS